MKKPGSLRVLHGKALPSPFENENVGENGPGQA